MKTRELIAALQKEDPSGDLDVVAGGTPIYFASREPAYYDGPLEMLIHDDSRRPYYSIVGYKVTSRGEKVKLHLMDVSDVLLDEPDAAVDLSELSEFNRERWEKRVAVVRASMLNIKEETKAWANGQASKLGEAQDRRAILEAAK